ncbi:hypothetical protein K432DRAFT_289452 [Lepidopterella palustris CBS 459.81]|uniref:FabD/lysophospholipase-like protein n=1 Tax=Lepidopterella palustris CBS 459.81 TaxID=1314670 RepID=A0A8E2EHR8_9PEZI|nr:hypothetical protein K432DRAFT_289452 [Lepidopterella palustris CBS 459.81]
MCTICWDRQIAHKKERFAPGKIPHEKTGYWIAKKVQAALSPPKDETVYQKLCLDDQSTAWFGVRRDIDEGPLMFQDHGRYAGLVASTNSERFDARMSSHAASDPALGDVRTPSLVSLVGQTGAGKSTLVKLLIDLKLREPASYPTPVVGMSGKDVPTSDDVHLYVDPYSALSGAPLFYADCEGLDGGQREPFAAQLRRKIWRTSKPLQDQDAEDSSFKSRYGSERELLWADSSNRRSREFAVSNLYPRLLYTFSDVIIFVLRNPRVIESVFEQLIDWAAVALETSSNQPVLPHAVIALNACEYDVDPELWDVEVATKTLLESLSRTVHLNTSFQKYARFWRDRNKDIETVEQLMLCYYSSLQIVRIPSEGRPNLIQQQTERLYEGIQRSCRLARERKRELRMLLDAEELQSYLQYAFDHFAQTIDVAFDFVQASFFNSPIPLDFGGNILKLAINMVEQEKGDADARTIFSRLSYMVASCILLDSVRHKILGTASHIFPQYLDHLDAALEDFCDRHWPCEFSIEGSGLSRCVNVRSGHGSKGHQLKSGKVFAAGDYVSEFSFEKNQEEFHANVYFRLEHLLERLSARVNHGESQEMAAAEIHRDDVMAAFYCDGPKGSVRTVHSHSVCFSCLFEPPEHALPCGHILCTPCVKTYGRVKDGNVIEVYECPMETNAVGRSQPWTVQLKPEAAGLRILTLDGGGIRNVIQLEILRLIERQLNGKVPIQCLFDLIIGSGTGGVIALGLATRNWSVEECLGQFERICMESFSHRAGRDIPGIGWLVESINNCKYDSHSTEKALQEAFSDSQYLFGGPRPSNPSEFHVKAAVLATTPGGNPVVLANYNRQSRDRSLYHFCRSENLATELKVWEAARASMATPKLFKPFHHAPSKQTYLECGTNYNNPIAVAIYECRVIKTGSNFTSYYPDIVVSLGTGYEPPTHQSPVESPHRNRLMDFATRKLQAKGPKQRIPSAAQSQKIWDDYIGHLPATAPFSAFVRLNPILKEGLATTEAFWQMKPLETKMEERLAEDGQIKLLASQLLAALFYFESTDPITEIAADHFVAQGT